MSDYRKWIEKLGIMADEMEANGEEVNASHLDMIIQDLNFQHAQREDVCEIFYKNGEFDIRTNYL